MTVVPAMSSQAPPNEAVSAWTEEGFWDLPQAPSEPRSPWVTSRARAFESALESLDQLPDDQKVVIDDQLKLLTARVVRSAIQAQVREDREETRRLRRLGLVAWFCTAALIVLLITSEWDRGDSLGLAVLLVGILAATAWTTRRVLLSVDRETYWFIAFIGLGFAALAFVVARPYPGLPAAIVVATFLGGGVYIASAVIAFAAMGPLQVAIRLVRGATEPWAYFITALLDAYDSSRRQSSLDDGTLELHYDPVWSLDRRREIARILDRAAVRVERDADVTPRLTGRFAPETRDGLRNRGERVAAWLRQVENEILWPSPVVPWTVQSTLASGLAAACLGQWSMVEADPPANRVTSWLRRMLPRVALAAALIAVAWLVPSWLDSDDDSAIQTTLVVAAISVLVGAPDALSQAVKSVQGQLKS
jgi:hypothetical protein